MRRSQGFGRGKTIIRIHCMKKSIFSKIKVEEKKIESALRILLSRDWVGEGGWHLMPIMGMGNRQ